MFSKYMLRHHGYQLIGVTTVIERVALGFPPS